MAIQIKKLGTRAFSALFFVLVLLGCLLWNYYSFTVFFFITSLWALQEFFALSEKQGIAPYRISGFISAVIVYLCFVNYPLLSKGSLHFELFFCLPAVFFMVLGSTLIDKKPAPFTNAVWTLFGLCYAVLPFGLLHLLVVGRVDPLTVIYLPEILFGVILLIWCNDTFAYLGGSVFGKRKMIERISPGKTWEGTLIGIACTFAASFLLREYINGQDDMFWLLAGLFVPVLATVGDLFESVMKRQAGIKDTGSIMPGHGGILDRFDSLIFVTPFVLLLISLRG